ncbi:HAD hydrolase-like protein [Cupriavidus taiwanensis]|uniref:HYDROLASE PHOSPHATASE PROTEIN, Haloacid dehalogenase-like hydrolase n=1 Tax=Cupriavidus taiwanensis (strain DSM 17343 / BCRC 17206 / CCUG 44338 / CIP 107171 / LMG 19424 / R1) TaxID=977880 RepID=B2AIM8_CUPTR|nr:HAD hydrolase-like protein [Cupriavidus taiwanensis]CAP63627.1 putative HYDROLASE PHOSPHATASE PROTEIN, Haloacid dehalogenase-like hydrolase [Cupriavidus taiwanensis LMG 19424]
MTYKLIAFDFDGTLADSLECFLQAVDVASRKHGFRPLEGDLLEQARSSSAHNIMRLLGVPLWKVPAITVDVRRLMHERIAQVSLFPNVANTLNALALRGISLAVATSNGEDVVRTILGPAVCERIGHFSCGISMFGKTRKLRALISSAGVRPDEALYVGDEIRDAQAASDAGMAFRGVAWGYTAAAALQLHCATPLLARPQDLLDLGRT